MFVQAQRAGAGIALRLEGAWHSHNLATISSTLERLDTAGAHSLTCDIGTASFDLSGAWLLNDYLARLEQQGLKASFSGTPPDWLDLIERTSSALTPVSIEESDTPRLRSEPATAMDHLGRRAVAAWALVGSWLNFIGRVSFVLARAITSLRRLRPISVLRHVYDTGITAIPIVSLIAFLISVILAYMGAQQLVKFGADIYVVDLVTVGVLRELGVLLTAIIVAGRSGSAFAAEIGAMQLNEEVDALHAIGVDPIEALVLPRVIGLVIALPLLTVVADAIGLVGGGLLCHTLLGMPLSQYLHRAQESIASTTFWVGLLKAPVFAVLIAVSGTWCGMRVRGSSRDLGRLTTTAVVMAIFLVLLADALFAVLFMQLDV
jgi:phospholipid/cholesterol/gamma-HCH transport system permease protein